MADGGPIPLVIVQGFLGTSGSWIWGNFEHYLNLNTLISNSVGPVSSLHDRACELYYALMGGTVDYGLEHSKAHKHARYGRNIVQGQYPEWRSIFASYTRFLTLSKGGPTVIKLQSLIKQGHFGPSADTKMILSINASMYRSHRSRCPIHSYSQSPLPFAVRSWFICWESVQMLHRPSDRSRLAASWENVYTSFSYLSPLLPQAVDFHGDCRSLTYRDISFLSLLRQLWKSDWAESRDATPFDVTFQAADERESDGEGVTDPDTFYQSHVASMTRRHSESSKIHTPVLSHIVSPFMYIYLLVWWADLTIPLFDHHRHSFMNKTTLIVPKIRN
ncbi:hypothetical protein MVEN_01521700 [Mycena venus]|uniref:Lipase-like C-terminal domain-containing protein n=1 Tax=Mycena venus TaxID=2733690 RepID=A0A8H6XWI9_9AGAR|nr:hypothetical protein MVEN_01521700 [Mycena venus]